MAELRAGATPVQVSGARVSSDAVQGTVVAATSLAAEARSTLLEALSVLGLRSDQRLGLDVEAVASPSAAGRRSRSAAAAAAVTGPGDTGDVLVEVPPPAPGQGQVLLVDNGGAVSWILPERPADGTRSRGAAVTRFRVPVAPPAAGDLPGHRGVLGKLARRVLHVLTFDLVDKVAGEVGDFFVREWEKRERPHRLRSFTSADYRDPKAASLDATSIRRLGGAPALLMVHGTNSLCHSGFTALPPDAVAALNRRYEDRVFAFDHPTLSIDPLDNCKILAGLLPDDLPLEVDVLAHSRGGLVARVLAELPELAGTATKLRVRQVVFVATPNLGTPLADPDHFGELLDALTNLLDLVPDNPVTDSLAGIVAVVRQLAVGALEGLNGLMAQNQKLAANPFLTQLNSSGPHGARYRAVVADYEPPPNTPRGRWLRDAAIDALFGWEPNDLIVPTASTYSWNGAANFPITERIVLPPERAVDHSTFWTAQEALNAFTTWLSPEASALRPTAAAGAVSPARSSKVEDPLAEVDERFVAGDIEGVRQAVRGLPPADLKRLEAQVGDLALDSFVSRGLRAPKAGVVFVLPGIMGSNLWADEGDTDRDRIWLNPLRLVKGDFRRLRVADGAGRIRPGGLHRSYLPLVMALDARWDVVPAGFDWRLPLEAAAESVAQRIRDKFAGQPGPAHLVCHSMGGLVARMLVARHNDVWQAIDNEDDRNKGGRLVMLGTPNLGSFAIALALSGDDQLVQWLARVDLRNSRKEILGVLGTFPGAYQLLTSPDVEIDDSAHVRLYDDATWGSDTIVAAHLGAARDAHARLAADGLDPERMYYVAGSGHPTPAAVQVDPAKPGRFQYRMTDAGDGRVTHQLGLPLDAAGEPVFKQGTVWYSTVTHGDLTSDQQVVAAVGDVLETGKTTRLDPAPPARARGAATDEDRWIPAELVEPPMEERPVALVGRSMRSVGPRAQLRAEAEAGADLAVQAWLGSTAGEEAILPLAVGVLHASLEYSSHPVMVGHYRGDPLAGAEGYLDSKLNGVLNARHIAGRYPEELGEVLRIPTSGRPPGALVMGLGPRGDLTPAGLASAARDAALEHAFGWLHDPCHTGDGQIGLSTCLIGSYGVAGLTRASAVAAIVEGVVLANVLLDASTSRKVRIATLEFVERYEGAAEEAAHVMRDIYHQLPGGLRDTVDLRPDLRLRQGKGRRPAVRTADYGAGQWHRIVVRSGDVDRDGRMKLQYTSFGLRARADQLEQEVDAVLLRRMLEEAVLRPTVDGRINTAMFEMLFPNDIKRELAGVENIHLVLDPATADFPWEALSDRGGLSGGGPVALRGGFLRQLSTEVRRHLEPLSSAAGALVIGDPPGGERFARLEGARREAREVADLLEKDGQRSVERLIFSADTPEDLDSASQVASALMGKDFQIVHIAGHGHFEPRPSGPPLGGVVIGPGAYLTAATLRSLRRPPDIVFLNCCHLGSLGATNIDAPTPDGLAFTRRRLNQLAASLSLELTAMGVRAVVVAGWAVSDAPAAEFARAFYSHMLAGALFGDAVRAARDVAFAADGGATNTWAAYQCYGDPGFRLGDGSGGSTPSTDPVSADELRRRLEEIEVNAREADDTARQDLSRQVRDQYPLAEKEWPRDSRMWGAFGLAHGTLGEVGPAITAYRRALDRQDGMVPLRAVENLADLEHELSVELLRQGLARAEDIDTPFRPGPLRTKAWERLASLDRLGKSADRRALRARCHEREAVLHTERGDEDSRRNELSAAAADYMAAWRLSGDDRRPRDAGMAVSARQLLALGAELADEVSEELDQFLDAWRLTQRARDFPVRVAVADLTLAEKLQDIDQDATRADVAATYNKVFNEGSAPDQRKQVVARISALAKLTDEPAREALVRLADELSTWSSCG